MLLAGRGDDLIELVDDVLLHALRVQAGVELAAQTLGDIVHLAHHLLERVRGFILRKHALKGFFDIVIRLRRLLLRLVVLCLVVALLRGGRRVQIEQFIKCGLIVLGECRRGHTDDRQ